MHKKEIISLLLFLRILKTQLKYENIRISLFQCYMRALFDYEPEEDTLLPCKEIGLKFSYGDILQVNSGWIFMR